MVNKGEYAFKKRQSQKNWRSYYFREKMNMKYLKKMERVSTHSDAGTYTVNYSDFGMVLGVNYISIVL